LEGNGNKESLITIGKIVKSFGVRGEVVVEILTDFPRRFIEMEELLLVKENSADPPMPVFIESARFHKKKVILKLDIIQQREDVGKYRNYLLKIPKEELMELSPDEFYIFDLLGLKVHTTKGDYIGNITKVVPAGYHDVYEICHPESGDVNLVPAMKKFIKEVNIEERRMVVEPIEGLFDL